MNELNDEDLRTVAGGYSGRRPNSCFYCYGMSEMACSKDCGKWCVWQDNKCNEAN